MSANMIMNAVPPTLMMIAANIVNATAISNKIIVKIICIPPFIIQRVNGAITQKEEA